jgi:hypothetical protein
MCTPLDLGAQMRKEGTPLTAKECGGYTEMVGCLLYVAVCTRPDVQFAASALARYMSCPTRELMRGDISSSHALYHSSASEARKAWVYVVGLLLCIWITSSGAVCVSIGKWTRTWNVWPEEPTSKVVVTQHSIL